MDKSVGLVGAPRAFIDHIAPLCSILGIEIHTSEFEAKLLEPYYPNLNIRLKQISLQYLLENYDNIVFPFRFTPSFSSIVKSAKKSDHLNLLFNKKINLIYTLHGCSDKGYGCDWLSPDDHFREIDLALIYGNRMKDLFKDKGLLDCIKNYLIVGNYRYAYYQEHKEFLDQLTHDKVFKYFEDDKPIIFYAPSWKDRENSCSFEYIFKALFKKLPKEFNLLVKLHPHMKLGDNCHNPKLFRKSIEPYLNHPQIVILQDFPLVFPLLNKVDFYLGDTSSIGYDFLKFNKPMFFVNHNQLDPYKNKGAYLQRCGASFLSKDFQSFYSSIEKTLKKDQSKYSEIRLETYDYAFGKDKSCKEIKDLISTAILNNC